MTTSPVSLRLRMRGWYASQEIMRLAALVAIAAFLADSISKSWAIGALTGATPMFGSNPFSPAHNQAFAFSAGADMVSFELVMGIRLVVLMAVGVVFGRLVVRDQRSAAGFGLILGGGFGNTADLAFRGHVIDFINIGPFRLDLAGEVRNIHFVMNAADLAILIGIALLAPRLHACALEVQRRIGEWETRFMQSGVYR